MEEAGTKHMMEEGAPTTIDNDGCQHDQQPIPDGEPAATGLPSENHHEQRSTASTSSITPGKSTAALTSRSSIHTEDTDDVTPVEETIPSADTSPVVSLPESQHSKLTISGTCHN